MKIRENDAPSPSSRCGCVQRMYQNIPKEQGKAKRALHSEASVEDMSVKRRAGHRLQTKAAKVEADCKVLPHPEPSPILFTSRRRCGVPFFIFS